MIKTRYELNSVNSSLIKYILDELKLIEIKEKNEGIKYFLENNFFWCEWC